MKHESGHYLKVKYDWINSVVGEAINFPVHDTGFLKDWNLYQIEGEEPIVQEEVDPKAKAAAKKPSDAKKGGASKLEEVADNRPRTVNYERDFAAEANGIGLEITEEVAIKFSEAVLNLQVFETNTETQEEALIETIQIDLSCLLFQETSVDVSLQQPSLARDLTFLSFAAVLMEIRQDEVDGYPSLEPLCEE